MASEAQTKIHQEIMLEAKKRFKSCEEWESFCRPLFDDDTKFANGDSDNKYQWPSALWQVRELDDRPVLTINKTHQHNLMIINDAKQNKPGIKISPVGDEASFEAAQIYGEIIRHIEYISSAETIYDRATTTQVEAGIGYWRIVTDYVSDNSFDQEIYIKGVKNPKSVYLDPNINEIDGSDATFGFIFEDWDKDLFDTKYPDFKHIASTTSLDNTGDSWLTKDTVRVAEYFRKTQKADKLCAFINPITNEQVIIRHGQMDPELKKLYLLVKNAPDMGMGEWKERKVVTDDIQWFKIAGNEIIEEGVWLGKYIPIVRVIGTETVIDGILDRKGHTRALKDAQRIYNYNTSSNVEYGALQTKAPWVAPAAAIEGFEEYYRNANKQNYAFLPYNHIDEDGNTIPPPTRPASPQSSPAYVQQMQIAQNEMMMVSGQYQAQTGENENAKSGIAINARQRQGDRATYHFIDNLAIAVRFTGRILIDLIPKVYDTVRVIRIAAMDGSIMNVKIDPKAPKPYEKLPLEENAPTDKAQQMAQIVFNPNVGTYDIQSDTGPSYATRRQEAFNALTQIAAQNKDFMNIGGDLLFKVADFPEADILAERWKKIIPKNITGDGIDPKFEEAMNMAAAKIEQLTTIVAEQSGKLKDRDRELDIREYEAATARKTASAGASRLDYEAENKRMVALGNSGPAITPDQIKPVLEQLLRGMLLAGEPNNIVIDEPVDDDDNQLELLDAQPINDEPELPGLNGAPPPEMQLVDDQPTI